MTISITDWLAYIKKLSLLDKTASAKMQAYVSKHGFEDTKALIDYAYGIVAKYGEGSAALAAQMYDTIAELSGEHLPAAELAPIPEYGEVAKTVKGTAKYRNADLVSNAVGRLVKRTGVDTTMRNAIRDGAQWAWIPHGDTCAFCLTLASRGWQKASKAALKGGHAEHIHAHCDCTYAISFDGNPKYAGYDPDKYLEMYDSAEGISSKDKINSLRRQKYQENKDKISAQKRAAYANKKINDIIPIVMKEKENEDQTDKIEDTPFYAFKSLSAAAQKFYVEDERQIRNTEYYIKPGTYVTGVKVITTGENIREIDRLINTYKLPNGELTKAKDWYKVRGRADITDGKVEFTREIHWYQAENIGKVEFKFPSNKRQK